MRILVAGNTGYVGPVVVKALRKSHPDAEIVGLDSGFFAHCLTNAPALPERRIPPKGELSRFSTSREVNENRLPPTMIRYLQEAHNGRYSV